MNQILAKVLSFFRKEKLDREMAEEMQFHLNQLAAEKREDGLTPEEAHYAARRKFGNAGVIQEVARDERGLVWLEHFGQDLRYAARSLRRSPGFTAVVVLTLALGIGANTAIFSVVYGVLLRPLPYPEPAQLVQCNWGFEKGENDAVTDLEFDYWKNHNRSFSSVAGYKTNSGVNLTGGMEPRRVHGLQVSMDFFRVLGVSPVQGRPFNGDEDRPKGANAVIVTDRLWRDYLGADPALLGQPLSVNGRPCTVVGILPAGFQFATPADLFLPLQAEADPGNDGQNTGMIARLKPGLSLAQAQADVTQLFTAFRQDFPKHAKPTERGFLLQPLRQAVVGDAGKTLWLLLGATACVLLIACANVANLLLARATARRGEIALRLALGAGRGRIVRQLLTEGLVLAVAGSLVGFLLAKWSVPALLAFAPASLPRVAEVTLEYPMFGFAVPIAVVATIVAGLLPASSATRLDVNDAIKTASLRTGAPAAGVKLRGWLVAAEAALAVILLVGAGLFIRSFLNARSTNLGFKLEQITTMQASLTSARYGTTAQIWALEQRVLEQLSVQLGIAAAATATNVPLERGLNIGLPFNIAGQSTMTGVELCAISPRYFAALGIPLVRGRGFADTDSATAPPVMLVNETLAKQISPGGDPIGETVPMQRRSFQIVGVVSDIKGRGPEQAVRPTVYVPVPQLSDQMLTMVNGWFLTSWIVRTAGPIDVAAAFRTAVQEADAQLPIANIRSLQQVLGTALQARAFLLLLMGVFAGLALVLTAIGVYGVLSYQVARRTNEIGVRVALGANAGDIVRLVLGQGLRYLLAGIAVGLITSLGLTRLIASLLFGVSPTDPLTFAAIAALLTGVGTLACLIPARRAMKVDPMIALRCE